MILNIPGVADALRHTPAPVVGISPIVSNAPVRGMADACLKAIGVETSAAAVAKHYGARINGGLIDYWLIDESDSAAIPEIEAAGIQCIAVPLMMTDIDATGDMARAAIDFALSGN
jgi:LPPG:FO 2-phospho-L-lactate transferase